MDSVILLDRRGKKYLVHLEEGMIRVEGLGVLDSKKLALSIGKSIDVAGNKFIVLTPSMHDYLENVHRRAQIVVAKDSASIVQRCDIGTGNLVVEGGAGSGALTMALARAVFPTGKVVSYEVRKDFADIARKNISMAGLSKVVEIKEADIEKGIDKKDVNAVVLDLPEPWKTVPLAWDALKPCGFLASYSPTMEQVKETVRAMSNLPFVDIRTTEILEREIEVKETGVRPSFATLGHTGYISTARKVLELFN